MVTMEFILICEWHSTLHTLKHVFLMLLSLIFFVMKGINFDTEETNTDCFIPKSLSILHLISNLHLEAKSVSQKVQGERIRTFRPEIITHWFVLELVWNTELVFGARTFQISSVGLFLSYSGNTLHYLRLKWTLAYWCTLGLPLVTLRPKSW